MRLMTLGACIALVCLPLTAKAEEAGEVWQVVEGPNGSIKGVWNVTREGNRLIGNAHMVKGNGAPLSYNVTGTIQRGQLVVNRTDVSDRTECHYLAGTREDEDRNDRDDRRERGSRGDRGDRGDRGRDRDGDQSGGGFDRTFDGTTLCGQDTTIWRVVIAPRPPL